MKRQIENFLARFPKNATNWAQATEEIRDLSRESREYLQEMDGVIVEPVDFHRLRTPAEWNTKGRDSIIANYDRMRKDTRTAFFERFKELFCEEE